MRDAKSNSHEIGNSTRKFDLVAVRKAINLTLRDSGTPVRDQIAENVALISNVK